jgi:hypothetical protein
MNTAEINTNSEVNVLQLARSIRFALVTIVVAFSYLSIRSSLSIGHFQQIYMDMLGGRPLPSLTVLVINARPVFVLLSLFVPFATVATLFLRSLTASFYVIGSLGFLTIVEFIVLYHGLSAPLTQIISGMSSMSGGPAFP